MPLALLRFPKGGIVSCAGTQMITILAFPYYALQEKRIVHSAANLKRRYGKTLFGFAMNHDIQSTNDASLARI